MVNLQTRRLTMGHMAPPSRRRQEVMPPRMKTLNAWSLWLWCKKGGSVISRNEPCSSALADTFPFLTALASPVALCSPLDFWQPAMSACQCSRNASSIAQMMLVCPTRLATCNIARHLPPYHRVYPTMTTTTATTRAMSRVLSSAHGSDCLRPT